MSTAGPYTLQFPMVYHELSHDFEVNCDVLGTPVIGSPADEINLRTRNGDGADLDSSANDLWSVIRTIFHTDTLCSSYVLYKRNVHNEFKEFVSAGDLSAPNGSNATLNTDASQLTLTWQTGLGHIMKFVLLEFASAGANSRTPIGASGAPIIAIDTFVRSGLGFCIGRDRAFPVAAKNCSYGQNEKIFRRRFRS
jgi:hypothetical protein